MSLEILTSDLLAGTPHGFFTLRGGASSGIYAGLNCGSGSADQRDAVTINRGRVAAAIGFLQMKRWGHQWMIVTCWMGVVIWCAYVFNMTMFADVRYAGVVFPVIGWWLYDIFYITPFLAIPYLHTVNREIFSD